MIRTQILREHQYRLQKNQGAVLPLRLLHHRTFQYLRSKMFLFALVSTFLFVPLEIMGKTNHAATGLVAQGRHSESFDSGLTRIKYNNPGLIVDLGVGLWAVPVPADFTGDGNPDLLVGSGGRPYNGIYYFEAKTEANGETIFKPAVRLSDSPARYNLQVSHVGNDWIITEPGIAYPDFKNTFLDEGVVIPYEPDFEISRANQWRYFDYNGNGKPDLIIGASDWREYRWDDAYTEEGKWTNGPLRAYVYWIENLGTTEAPEYGPARKVMAGNKPVEVYGMPSANFADFTGNGLPDLILGEFLDRLTFFENIGTRSDTEFAPGKHLKFQGEVIKMDLQMIQPSAIDWNGNGHMDLVVGDEDGRVALVEHTGRFVDGVPEFKPPVYFRQVAHEVKVGALATPYAYDWNGNGLQDLIVGNTAGHLVLLENLGGYPPRWAAPRYLEADGELIRIQAGENGSIQGPAEAKWGYTVLSIADWNNNGLPDLIVNSIWGEVLWYENVGTCTHPKLTAARPIEVEWTDDTPKPVWNWWKPADKSLVTQWRSTVQAIDINQNGLTDLVAMDQEGFLVLFERYLQEGELKLMPPKRVFLVENDQPSAFDSGHAPAYFGENIPPTFLEGYDEQGNLHYMARTRRSSAPRVMMSVYRLPGISTLMNLEDLKQEIGKPLRMNAGWAGWSGRRKFHLVDWNGNGRLDLIVNSHRNARLLENISDEPGVFLFRDRGEMDEYPLGGHTSNPVTVDWNQNGIPDLLIGAEDGFLYYKPNPRSLE